MQNIFLVFVLLILVVTFQCIESFKLVPYDKSSWPIPTPAQLKYQGGFSALIHFGMATYFHDGDPGCDVNNWNGCDPNGACNSSDPKSFNPTLLNVSNWMESFNDLGIDSAVLTAKHGCGFLTWVTNTTLPNGSAYSYKVNENQAVVPLFVKEMQKAGLGYGFYYSLTNNFYLNVFNHKVSNTNLLPGQVKISQTEFEDLALNQIHELWTNFGDLTEIWLDGGCGTLCDRVGKLLNSTLAVNAVAWNGGGGTSSSPIRWCGTESGSPAGLPTVWSTANCSDCPNGDGQGVPPNSTNAEFIPSGVDVTLQTNDHWFYMPNMALHTLSELAQFYHNSIGSNGHLEIDFAIDRTGRVDPVHAARYKEFGTWIRQCYGTPLASNSLIPGQTTVKLSFQQPTTVDRFMMKEDQTQGQNIISWSISGVTVSDSDEVDSSSSALIKLVDGVAIGAKRIVILEKAVLVTELVFTIDEAFNLPPGLIFQAFDPEGCIIN